MKIQLRQRGDRSVYLGKLIDWEERWRGEKGGKLVEGGKERRPGSAIDHVTPPAITSDTPEPLLLHRNAK